MAELSWTERVDDGILVAAYRLSHLRDGSLRTGVADFQQTCIEMRDVDPDDVWPFRLDRCNVMLNYWTDDDLRSKAKQALARER